MDSFNVWEEKVVIPTYEVGKPDKNPMFLEHRVYQGSSGKIYPYPTTQEISRKKTDHTYHAVFLENKYIKIMVLPELGGRIQRAYDKTNDYDFVYYNQVIKPALVGLTGPWISGGIEFNWPQHHRPTTFMPTDYAIVDNTDGGKSLLIGDVDQMYGTKVVTKFTIYPDKAYLKITGQLYNRTPLPQTFLWWANPAVSVNDDTQSIFPPDVHSVYDHGKRDVSRFPIATGVYYKHDYSEGVDISRYKNIPVPTSYMAERSDYDFVGGYDYGKKAGLLHVADHHVSPGKKQWTWGCGDFGKAWDRNLTDEDGPYIELMTGMFCDNQPDFSWLKPFEEKTFDQYFMPYKNVGQVKNATIHAMLNMEERDEGIFISAYATEKYQNAEIILYENGVEIAGESTILSPVDMFEKTFAVKYKSIYDVKAVIKADGKVLVEYQPKDQGIPRLAEPARAAEDPEKILTNEELYLTAQHIEQYRHATYLPDPYYLEGLKRDPGDIRINNAYGCLLMRRGLFSEAERYIRKAIERLTFMHPNPYFSEPFYNLGVTCFYQEKYDEAYNAFYKATWSSEEQEMSFYYLAVIACRNAAYDEALGFIDKSLVKNAHNIKARGLRAMILVKLGEKEMAEEQIADNLKLDTFDYMSRYAEILLYPDNEKLVRDYHRLSRDFYETGLRIARDFAESGFYDCAIKVLDLCRDDSPLIYYYKGYYLEKTGNCEAAKKEYTLAEKKAPDYCFPNKLEDISVLESAQKSNSDGAKAYYYLGNLFYDRLQFERAIELWEKSVECDGDFPTVLRNLAIAYFNKRNDADRAREMLEKAFALDESDARVFLELDQLYKKMNYSPEDRLELYKAHIGLIEERDDLYTEYVTVLNQAGRFEEAHKAICAHVFRTWEGAEGKITGQFKIALSELAKAELKKKDYSEAKRLLLESLSYPENLGEGRLEGTKDNDLYYLLGLAEEGLGNRAAAEEDYRLATLGAQDPAGVMYYYDQPADMIMYQGLAFKKLGNVREANSRFYRLIDYGEKHVRDIFKMDYFAVSMPDFLIFDDDMTEKNKAHCYYLMGLGNLGLGNNDKALEALEKTISIDPNHQKASIYVNL